MLQNLSSLEETAERFRQSPEFIWNMSLQFNRLLQPELGDNGFIAYSELQRHIIGRIIKMREEGMTYSEIIGALELQMANEVQTAPATLEQPTKARCPSSEVCRKNFKTLSEQVKLMRAQITLLKNELAKLKQEKPYADSSASLDLSAVSLTCSGKNLLGRHHPDA